VEIPRLESCAACHGHGTEKGKEPSRCERCGGAGQIRVSQGFFVMATTCGTCGGTGHVIKHPCPECRGRGRLERTRRLKVKFPPGVDTGSRLRLSGEGEGGVRGGGRGDLYVAIVVQDHALYGRHGDDLLCEVPVSFPTAVLGGEIEVPTLSGSVEMKIPAGTPPGRIFRLRGKGMPRLEGGGHGDQLVRVTVSVPEKVTPQQRELLKQFEATLSNGRQGAHARSFTEKVREAFR
jgi:molecular chaperone DnaJ